MHKNKRTTSILFLLVFALLAAGTVYAVSGLGTKENPLVTMSYLEDVVRPEMMDSFEGSLHQAVEQSRTEFGTAIADAAGAYRVVSLQPGESLSGSPGTELLLRSGTAKAVGELSDGTDGLSLPGGGTLSPNHLYFILSPDDGFIAVDAVTVMVRGTASVS